MTQQAAALEALSRPEALLQRIVLVLALAGMLILFPMNTLGTAIETLLGAPRSPWLWLGAKLTVALVASALIVDGVLLGATRAPGTVLSNRLRRTMLGAAVFCLLLAGLEAALPSEYRRWLDPVGGSALLVILGLTVRALPARVALCVGLFAIGMHVDLGGALPMAPAPDALKPLVSMLGAGLFAAWAADASARGERLRQPWVAVFALCGGVSLAADAGSLALPQTLALGVRLALPVALLLSVVGPIDRLAGVGVSNNPAQWLRLAFALFILLLILYDRHAVRWAFEVPEAGPLLVLRSQVAPEVMFALMGAALLLLFVFQLPVRLSVARMGVVTAGICLCVAALVVSAVAVAMGVHASSSAPDRLFAAIAIQMWSWPWTVVGEVLVVGGLLRLLLRSDDADQAARM